MKLNLNNFGNKLKITQRVEKEKTLTEEQLFIEIVDKLVNCWDKSNKIYELFKVNTLEYEEDFYQVVEDLFLIKYGPWKTEVVMWYIFGRIDIDGNIYPLLVQLDDNEEEKEIYLKTSKELWDFLIMVEKKRKNKE